MLDTDRNCQADVRIFGGLSAMLVYRQVVI